MISLDLPTVLNWAQQLEARRDPLHVAQEIRTALKTARPAVNPELHADAIAELKSYGCCHRPLHPPKEQVGKPCQCRWCRIMRAVG